MIGVVTVANWSAWALWLTSRGGRAFDIAAAVGGSMVVELALMAVLGGSN